MSMTRPSSIRTPPGLPRALKAASALAAVLVALPALAQLSPLDLIGNRPKPFIEPEGFYRVVLPSGFDCKSEKRHLECTGTRGRNALLVIDVLDVPRSATAKLHWLNQMARFREKPHFQELSREEVVFHDVPGMTVAFKYDYLGNVQYKVGVRATYLKQENKLYSIHFESRLDSFAAYDKDLADFYSTFKPTPLDPGGNPILRELKIDDKARTDADVDAFKKSHGY